MGGASPVSRSRAISPTAVASGTSSAVRARTMASPRTRESVRLARLSRTPAHCAGAERLDPGRFERIEHGAGVDVGRGDAGVEPGVVIAKPECEGVGGAARLGDQPGSSAGPGDGTRAVLPEGAATSDAKITSTSGSLAMAREAPARARRKSSVGLRSGICGGCSGPGCQGEESHFGAEFTGKKIKANKVLLCD